MSWELPPSPPPTPSTDPVGRLIVLTPPTGRPVTWAELRANRRLNTDTEQVYGELLIDAATRHAENAMGSSLMAQTLQVIYQAGDDIELPRTPLISIESVRDANDAAPAYSLRHVGRSTHVALSGGAAFPLTVIYQAGYASAAAIPADIRLAILMHAGTLFEQRESVSEKGMVPVPQSLEDFYAQNRRTTGIA